MRPLQRLVFAALVCLSLAPRLGAQRAAVPPALAAEAARGNPVRVLVGLAAPFAAEGTLAGPGDIAAQRARIAAAQDALLDRIAAIDAVTVTRFETIPFLAVTVDRAALDALAADAGVESLGENISVVPQLIGSTAIMGIDRVWPAGYTGTGWQVAILDTGVETSHSFFGGRVVSEACYSNNSQSTDYVSLCGGGVRSSTAPGSGTPCAISGCDHGTHVAGIAAGIGGPYSGVAPAASLIAVQVFSGVASCLGAYCLAAQSEDMVLASERVLALAGPNNANRVAAVNLSMGGGRYSGSCDTASPALKAAFDNLISIGAAVVVSTGNEGLPGNLGFPGCLSNVVTVASTNKGDAISSFSNRSSDLSLLATGEAISSSVTGNVFGIMSGTSMAAPHVTGAFALAKQMFPLLFQPQILRAFRATGRTIVDPVTFIPYPRLQVDTGLEYLRNTNPPAAPGTPVAAVSGPGVRITWTPAPWGGVTHYVVQGGLSPGSTLASVPVGLATSYSIAPLDPGRYYVRVLAVNPRAFAASPEISFVIGDDPPGTPANLSYQVTATSVVLSWTAPTVGPPRDYAVAAGTGPGRSNIATFRLGTTATQVSLGLPPPGNYYVRLHTVNNAGVSGPSNEVVITILPPPVPNAPQNLRFSLSGRTVALLWDAPTGALPGGYIVQAGSAPEATEFQSPPQPGTSLTTTAPPGRYFVRVIGVNNVGQGPPSNEVVITVP